MARILGAKRQRPFAPTVTLSYNISFDRDKKARYAHENCNNRWGRLLGIPFV